MPYFAFLWTPEREEHIAQHAVTVDEFEEVVTDPDRVETSRSSGLPIAFGYTSTGRYLACVYEEAGDGVTVMPVTAYEIEEWVLLWRNSEEFAGNQLPRNGSNTGSLSRTWIGTKRTFLPAAVC